MNPERRWMLLTIGCGCAESNEECQRLWEKFVWRSDQQLHLYASSNEDEEIEDKMQLKSEIK